MTAPTCVHCARPVADNARLCERERCGKALEQALAEVPALVSDLETTLARQHSVQGDGRGTGVERPLPFHYEASEAFFLLQNTLYAWARLVANERGMGLRGSDPASTSRVLLSSLTWLRHHPNALQAFDEIRYACRTGWNILTRATRIYVGPCDPDGEDHPEGEFVGPCLTDLYAQPDRREVACPRCGLVWDVAARRSYLLAAAQDQLVTAADLSRFLSIYGEPVNRKRINQWTKRGQLVPHGHTTRGWPLFRVGDVIDLLANLERRRA